MDKNKKPSFEKNEEYTKTYGKKLAHKTSPNPDYRNILHSETETSSILILDTDAGFLENNLHETKARRNHHVPSVDVGGSEGVLEANAKRARKYKAVITLSAATPAAKTDGETPRASEIAT